VPPDLSAIFLDRDGVINRKAPEGHYVSSWEEFEFIPGAREALALLAARRAAIIVATNQRGIALGRLTASDLADIHRRMLDAVAETGGRIDAVYHCPHDEGCRCRKPEVGMFEQAAREHGVTLTDSVLVGDSPSDMIAAHRIGALAVIVGDRASDDADGRFADLLAAARWLTGASDA
jgi:D-glycero-D-manno-heptose 1,7-bisphosphate phosphatase